MKERKLDLQEKLDKQLKIVDFLKDNEKEACQSALNDAINIWLTIFTDNSDIIDNSSVLLKQVENKIDKNDLNLINDIYFSDSIDLNEKIVSFNNLINKYQKETVKEEKPVKKDAIKKPTSKPKKQVSVSNGEKTKTTIIVPEYIEDYDGSKIYGNQAYRNAILSTAPSQLKKTAKKGLTDSEYKQLLSDYKDRNEMICYAETTDDDYFNKVKLPNKVTEAQIKKERKRFALGLKVNGQKGEPIFRNIISDIGNDYNSTMLSIFNWLLVAVFYVTLTIAIISGFMGTFFRLEINLLNFFPSFFGIFKKVYNLLKGNFLNWWIIIPVYIYVINFIAHTYTAITYNIDRYNRGYSFIKPLPLKPINIFTLLGATEYFIGNDSFKNVYPYGYKIADGRVFVDSKQRQEEIEHFVDKKKLYTKIGRTIVNILLIAYFILSIRAVLSSLGVLSLLS